MAHHETTLGKEHNVDDYSVLRRRLDISQPVMMAVFSPLAGRLSDRIEARLVASAGMALTTFGLTLIAFVNEASGLPHVVVALVLCGLGFALFSSPNMNVIVSSVDRRV